MTSRNHIARWLGCSAAVVLIALVVFATTATAGGGSTIATAPKVTFGAQTFGNTASVTATQCDSYEWWLVPLIAGDELVVNFENSSPSVGVEDAQLYAPSVNDFNLDNNDPTVDEGMNANSHAQLLFSAPSTGTYPLAFHASATANGCDGDAGAYDFTAYVHHKARLVMSLPDTISTHGSVTIQAHYPDGTVIVSGLGATLYGFWNKAWNKLGAAAVSNGRITIRYTIPAFLKGTKLKVEAKAGGTDFLAGRVSGSTHVG